MSAEQEVLIVAVSGRALAQSAAKTGWRVRVLDAFADRDTRATAETLCVGADHGIALDPDKLRVALHELGAAGAGRAIVVGSGFERSPHAMERLAEYGTLCANDADVVAALKDPELATELLRCLGWEVPDTRREPPVDRRGWLQKEVGGAGGMHVRRAERAARRACAYYQREARGRAMSATFLADGEQAWVLGFNVLASCTLGDAPFCYAGASTSALDPALERDLRCRLDRLVRITGLRGLNGLDFVLAGGTVQALEVNPRPTATFELYDPDYREGLVWWHLRSFARPLSDFALQRAPAHARARAYAIVYAEHAVRIPDQADFPTWCRDVPTAGSAIRAGAPVVSVFAEARNEKLARNVLRRRQHEVSRWLDGWGIGTRAGRVA